jgi:hypothetical protein
VVENYISHYHHHIHLAHLNPFYFHKTQVLDITVHIMFNVICFLVFVCTSTLSKSFGVYQALLLGNLSRYLRVLLFFQFFFQVFARVKPITFRMTFPAENNDKEIYMCVFSLFFKIPIYKNDN